MIPLIAALLEALGAGASAGLVAGPSNLGTILGASGGDALTAVPTASTAVGETAPAALAGSAGTTAASGGLGGAISPSETLLRLRGLQDVQYGTPSGYTVQYTAPLGNFLAGTGRFFKNPYNQEMILGSLGAMAPTSQNPGGIAGAANYINSMIQAKTLNRVVGEASKARSAEILSQMGVSPSAPGVGQGTQAPSADTEQLQGLLGKLLQQRLQQPSQATQGTQTTVVQPATAPRRRMVAQPQETPNRWAVPGIEAPTGINFSPF
jgi:hypothetical protein